MATVRPGRSKKTRYEAVLDLPPLPYEDFLALKNSIAVNGVLVPILVADCGKVRRIIDGNTRKALADQLGYECPEIVRNDLCEEDQRLLARCLNLARRHFSQAQKRQIIADQLRETPQRSNNCIGKQLGVHHATVASVRTELEATCQIDKFSRTLGADGKYRPAAIGNGASDEADNDPRVVYNQKEPPSVFRTTEERRARIEATTLIHGDCRDVLKTLPSQSTHFLGLLRSPSPSRRPEIPTNGVSHSAMAKTGSVLQKSGINNSRGISWRQFLSPVGWNNSEVASLYESLVHSPAPGVLTMAFQDSTFRTQKWSRLYTNLTAWQQLSVLIPS